MKNTLELGNWYTASFTQDCEGKQNFGWHMVWKHQAWHDPLFEAGGKCIIQTVSGR